jgi:hypothetical protein
MLTALKPLAVLALLSCAAKVHADPELIRILSRNLPDGSYHYRGESINQTGEIISSLECRLHKSQDALLRENYAGSAQDERVSSADGFTASGVLFVNYNSNVIGGRIEIIEGSADEIAQHPWARGLKAAVRGHFLEAAAPGLSSIVAESIKPMPDRPGHYSARARNEPQAIESIEIERMSRPGLDPSWKIYYDETHKRTVEVTIEQKPSLTSGTMIIEGRSLQDGKPFRNTTRVTVTRLPQTMPLDDLEKLAARYIRPDSVILRENLTTGSRMQKNGEDSWIPSPEDAPPPTPTRWPFYLAFALLTLAAAALPSWLRRRQSAAAR